MVFIVWIRAKYVENIIIPRFISYLRLLLQVDKYLENDIFLIRAIHFSLLIELTFIQLWKMHALLYIVAVNIQLRSEYSFLSARCI